MILALHQPNFLPNPGFFYKMAQADLFVVGTNIQFGKGDGWQRRQKIKTQQGDLWLTVPTLGSQNQKIKHVRINNADDWQYRHARTLQCLYSRTAESAFLHQLLDLYRRPYRRLVDINMASILLIKDFLGIPTPLVLDEDLSGTKENFILDACRKYQADIYLSGMGGKHYMTKRYFTGMNHQGIKCMFVKRNVTERYPYTTAHYILTSGRERVRQIIHAS